MTPAECRELAALAYAVPAASALLLEAVTAPPEHRPPLADREDRLRAGAALRCLDLGNRLEELPEPTQPLDVAAAAVAAVLVGLVTRADRRERLRLAGLLSALCREAERLGRREAA